MTETSDEESITKELHAWFGLSAYYVQCFEVELVTLHILLTRIDNRSMKKGQLDDCEDILSAETLGKLLKRLGQKASVSTEFQTLFDTYLSKRNYLMHHFFFHNSDKLGSTEGLILMTEELKELAYLFKEANSVAMEMSKNVRQRLGISEKDVEQEIAEYVEQTKNKYRPK